MSLSASPPRNCIRGQKGPVCVLDQVSPPSVAWGREEGCRVSVLA